MLTPTEIYDNLDALVAAAPEGGAFGACADGGGRRPTDDNHQAAREGRDGHLHVDTYACASKSLSSVVRMRRSTG